LIAWFLGFLAFLSWPLPLLSVLFGFALSAFGVRGLFRSLPLFPVLWSSVVRLSCMAVVAADCTGGDSHLKGAFGVAARWASPTLDPMPLSLS
jgi:hypothetical protein